MTIVNSLSDSAIEHSVSTHKTISLEEQVAARSGQEDIMAKAAYDFAYEMFKTAMLTRPEVDDDAW